MKRSQLTVPWREGLHLRRAAILVGLAQKFHANISLHANGRIADARSIVSVLLLCASLGTAIEVEASGDDEDQALQAVESAFTSPENTLDANADIGAEVDPDTDDQRR